MLIYIIYHQDMIAISSDACYEGLDGGGGGSGIHYSLKI